jgi:hypothetical protein
VTATDPDLDTVAVFPFDRATATVMLLGLAVLACDVALLSLLWLVVVALDFGRVTLERRGDDRTPTREGNT